MIHHPEIDAYAARHAAAWTDVLPLRVTVTIENGAGIAGYEPPNLDNLLAWVIVQRATNGRGIGPETGESYHLPLPLECLWRSERGHALWAATPLLPLDSTPDVAYWHKRTTNGIFTGTKSGKVRLSATNGRWMDRRTPLPVDRSISWSGTTVGNPESIAELLRDVRHLGKRRCQGHGEIREWTIEPMDAFALVENGRLLRSIPQAAGSLLDSVPAAAVGPVGWTPPQWKPGLFSPGWPLHTPVTPAAIPLTVATLVLPSIDWYAGVPVSASK